MKAETKNDIKQANKGQTNQYARKGSSNKVWDFFCSVKLAVVIILVLVVSCIIGTVILQEKTFDEYVARYGYGLATFFKITQLTNVFHSYWFSLLLILLCANLICCTIKRWRNTFLQTGFVLTHLSLVLILIGGVVKFQLGVKGGVNVYEGKSVNYFLTQTIDRKGKLDYVKKDLPFSIALDDFILEKNEPKFQLVSYVKSKDRQKVLEVKIGKKQRVPGSDYKVTIKDYVPDAELKQEPVNASDKPDNPAIFVKFFGSEKVAAEGWLLAYDRNSYEDKKQGIRIEYIWLSSQQELDKALNSVETAKAQVSVSMSGQTQDYPLDLNKVFKFEGTDFTVKMLQYVLNYGDRRPLGEQPPDNPAVQVEINGPEGAETRWVFEKFADWDKMHPAKYKNLKITCSGIAGTYMAKNTVRIYQTPEGKQVLVYIKDKEIAETMPWELEKKYAIPDTGNQVVVASYFPTFDFKKEVIKKSDEVKSPAIFAEVEGPNGKVEDWIFSSNQYATWYTDNNFALVYESTGESVKHFTSKLRIEENGQTVAEKTIRVNDPLEYKGYAIYQSSYDPEAGTFSGLQIVKDPGISVVYSGFGALCFGVVFIFYIKPFLRKKLKKEVEE
ncbi:MAG: cytochrome c biogenesis protein ResB [Planctomycetes bacterium]|uniref:cytochrome c biogenesis protein ResB n=1 Tax=Candidatus Wunengus sp. YC65 TaxID=3367701 RepID=UPI001D6E211E|nr:cytochrome c biogenesis protein ResB [Planctomycetota bacterium]